MSLLPSPFASLPPSPFLFSFPPRFVKVRPQIPHTLLLGKGQPREIIIQEADSKVCPRQHLFPLPSYASLTAQHHPYPFPQKVELLVIGRRGLNKVERLFVGSVSKYCAENAKCSVMVVRVE